MAAVCFQKPEVVISLQCIEISGRNLVMLCCVSPRPPRYVQTVQTLVNDIALCAVDKSSYTLLYSAALRVDGVCWLLQLDVIRRCGHSHEFFFLELGRSAMTGSGELWLLVEDTVIAQNMHEAILK